MANKTKKHTDRQTLSFIYIDFSLQVLSPRNKLFTCLRGLQNF